MVEARFDVGEYQIVILSATEATALETWLRTNHYNIPANAEPLLRPYVESGSKFFVARVDPQKVKFVDGRAALSPLRFHYDADELSLPIRLGLANSGGTQDLIVNILAPDQRYEVANYPNVTIPTNLDVKDGVKDHFGAFYAALFDRTLETHPNSVITEYAWAANSCDPCPGPVLDQGELMTLGADVLAGTIGKPQQWADASFVMTRLHARYGTELADDLVFREATPIAGGRESYGTSARADTVNNFQARYTIRHAWTGPIRCEHPHRQVWGGPPDDRATSGAKPALGLAFAPRGTILLADAIVHDIPEIERIAGASVPGTPSASGRAMSTSTTRKQTGCGCQTTERDGVVPAALLVGASLLVRRRRRS